MLDKIADLWYTGNSGLGRFPAIDLGPANYIILWKFCQEFFKKNKKKRKGVIPFL